MEDGTEGETRTHSQWFWRPLLYQLSYFRVEATEGHPVVQGAPRVTVTQPACTGRVTKD